MSTSVIYLLWAPFGAERARQFVDAYKPFVAGAEHELVVAACGHGPVAPLDDALAPFAAVEHRVEVFEGPRIDLRTYREAVDRLPQSDEFLFINSYGRPLADGWLGFITEALRRDGVGPVGPGGSYESFVANAPKLLAPYYLLHNPPFPNPHIRTSCFALTRESIELIDWPAVQTKEDAWRLEGGRKSITRQLLRKGRRPLVVGRDGKAFEVEEWPGSATFRANEQSNLLIADLRSDDYAEAGAEERATLERFAWGK